MEGFSPAAAICKRSFSLKGAAAIISVTSGVPFVSVPVLSKPMACKLEIASNDAADLKRRPRFRPTPLPTMIAVGVASPNAQGQAMTKTAIAAVRAKTKVLSRAKYQIEKVIRDRVTTAGTK